MELETFLERAARSSSSKQSATISNLINFAYVRQGEPLGLGHAVLVTRDLVGDEPFAVILGDDVIDADPPALKQMIDVFDLVQGPVLRGRARAARARSAATASSTASRAVMGGRASTASRIWSRSRRARRRRPTSRSSAATS